MPIDHGVHGVHPVPPDFIASQIRVVLDDLGADAIKTGMLGDAATVSAVVAMLRSHARTVPLVVDPVMVAKGGASLLAVGIRAIEGSFSRRDAVRLLSLDGRELGRGLTSLGSDELAQVLGQSSEAVRLRLGAVGDAVVHRDQLVLTPSPAAPEPAP